MYLLATGNLSSHSTSHCDLGEYCRHVHSCIHAISYELCDQQNATVWGNTMLHWPSWHITLFTRPSRSWRAPQHQTQAATNRTAAACRPCHPMNPMHLSATLRAQWHPLQPLLQSTQHSRLRAAMTFNPRATQHCTLTETQVSSWHSYASTVGHAPLLQLRTDGAQSSVVTTHALLTPRPLHHHPLTLC